MKNIAVVMLMMGVLAGCTLTPTTIERRYDITIYATEGSTVIFTPDIMADIVKKAEAQVDVETDADIDAKVPLIP